MPNTGNTEALRRAEMYSELVLHNLIDGSLPDGLHRDVADFGDGTTLNIPTFGEVVLRDLVENEDTPLDEVDNGKITLEINQHKGGATYFTDEMRQDNYKAAEFDASTVAKYTRAIKDAWETDMLNQQAKQTSANVNAVNGVAHRYVASGGSGARTLTIDDIVYAKIAFDKALMPDEGRILILDPLAEGSLNKITNLTNVSNNPHFEGIVETGFGRNMKFIKNVFGFDVFVSNKLPTLSVAEILDTSGAGVLTAPSSNDTGEVGDVVNQFWCVADDMTTPIMGAWRQMPRVEGDRNPSKRRDEFYASARWGFGLQRAPAMISLITSSTAY
jgi:hypothetical protein